MDPHPGFEPHNVKHEQDDVSELGSPARLEDSPQEPRSHLEDSPQEPRSHLEDSPQEPRSHLEDSPWEPRSHLEDSPQEPRSHLEDGPQEPRSHLEDSPQEPRSHLEDGPQEPRSHLEDSPQEPRSHLEDSPQEPRSDLEDSPQEPRRHMEDSPQEPRSHLEDSPQEPRNLSLEEDGEDDGHSPESTQNNQMVLYNPGEASNEASQGVPVPNPSNFMSPLPKFATSTPTTKVLPSVGAFTVQCARCFKWRLIPTKEKYEEIRAHIIEIPFVCETASEWRRGISCDDPADINQDGSRLWAIDKPSIAQPPPGWQRLLRIRGEGSTRFADVYYLTPSGKKLRSMVEIDKYLQEHPEFIEAGVNRSQFSFQIPKPLQENYVRKRPASRLSYDDTNHLPGELEPARVNPLAWSGTASDPYCGPSVFEPLLPPTKKRTARSPKQKMYSSDSMCAFEL